MANETVLTPLALRVADEIASVRWVAKNMADPVGEDDAPSPEAWQMLLACRNDPDLARAFWTKYVTFALKEDEDRQEEGPKGRKIKKMIDDLIEAAKATVE